MIEIVYYIPEFDEIMIVTHNICGHGEINHESMFHIVTLGEL